MIGIPVQIGTQHRLASRETSVSNRIRRKRAIPSASLLIEHAAVWDRPMFQTSPIEHAVIEPKAAFGKEQDLQAVTAAVDKDEQAAVGRIGTEW